MLGMRTCITNRKSPANPGHRETQAYAIGMPRPRSSYQQRDGNSREGTSSVTHEHNLRSRSRSPESDEYDYEPECSYAGNSDKNVDVVSGDGLGKTALTYDVLRQRVAVARDQLNRQTLSDLNLKTSNASKPSVQEKTETILESPGESCWKYLTLCGVLVVVGIFLFGCVYVWSDKSTPILDEMWLEKNMKIVGNEFPSQIKTIWSHFFSGIKKVLTEEPTEPSVFLLIHQDAETASCLARKVGQIAHDYLNASRPAPLVVDGTTLSQNASLVEDHGLLVEAYRSLVEERGVMILDNLESLPATLAQGLHSFCDTYTPLVRKAVYIFTLSVHGGNDNDNPTKAAERELYSLWGQLDKNILSPLVVRLTGGLVFRIRSEESVAGVC